MDNEKIIEFIRKKNFRFVKEIGQGGLGKTVLLKDEIINELFVCKKYSPYNDSIGDLYFENFVTEIKLLHLLYNINLVRVFNYYLYPEFKTGYILMEFVEGKEIHEFLKENPDKIDEIFTQTINGFKYLEEINVLHRDIRPQNILVSEGLLVKIIDFGFGKKVIFNEDFDKSISLNWRYNPPEEFESQIYDFKTEVYFVGKLFEEIIRENDIENFKYSPILTSMINANYISRINSFFEVSREIVSHESILVEFNFSEKQRYLKFADELFLILSSLENNTVYIRDIDVIQKDLEEVYRDSMLEVEIQNPTRIIRTFIKGPYKYYNKGKFAVSILLDFINLMKSVSVGKKKIIINNLWQRFDKLSRFDSVPIDDLPF